MIIKMKIGLSRSYILVTVCKSNLTLYHRVWSIYDYVINGLIGSRVNTIINTFNKLFLDVKYSIDKIQYDHVLTISHTATAVFCETQ